MIPTTAALRGLAFGPGDDALAVVSSEAALWLLRALKEAAATSVLRALPPAEGGSRGRRWRRVESSVLDAVTDATGAVWADFDADGDPDVCILRGGANRLLRNDGGGRFADAAAGAFRSDGTSLCAAWGDPDGDGAPDLFVGYEGAPGRLLRNEGGVLREALPHLGVRDARFAAWGDLDGDADLDLVTVSRFGAEMARNDGEAFADATPEEIRRVDTFKTSTLVDIDADGDLDFCANRSSHPVFYVNAGSMRFRRTHAPFDWNPRLFHTVSWCDRDGDGVLDCLVSAKAAAATLERESIDNLVLYDKLRNGRFREVEGRLLQVESLVKGLAWGDYDQDGRADVYVTREDGESMLLHGSDGGLEVDRESGLPHTLGRTLTSASWVDHDADGDLDLFLTDFDGACGLFRNETTGAHFLKVEIEGRAPNRFAVGAAVRVLAGGRWQTRMVAAIESLSSGHLLPLHFGLGQAAAADRIEVRWPGGRLQVLEGVPADQTLRIQEDESAMLDRIAPAAGLGSSADLDGRAALPPGPIAEALKLRWEKAAGPSGDAIADPGALVTSVRFETAGRYVYHLVCESADGLDPRKLLRLTVPVAPVGIEVHGAPPRAVHLLESPAAAGGAFDPGDPELLYVASKADLAGSGAIQMLRWSRAGLELERVLPAVRASAVVVSTSREVWFAREYPRGGGVPLYRSPRPEAGTFGAAALVIESFAGLESARPSALALVPPSFKGPGAAPGDIWIALSRTESKLPPAIGKYTPGAAVEDPKACAGAVEAPGLGPEWKGLSLGDIDFAPDGSEVYFLPRGRGFVSVLDPTFERSRKVVPNGVQLTRLVALAVHPGSGRVWVADDLRDEVWSLDPKTGAAERELSFVKEDEKPGGGNAIRFPSPSLKFSADGKRLVVSDASGWLWAIEWE